MSELIRMNAFDQVIETTIQTNIKSVMGRERYNRIVHFFPQSQKPQIS